MGGCEACSVRKVRRVRACWSVALAVARVGVRRGDVMIWSGGIVAIEVVEQVVCCGCVQWCLCERWRGR